MDLSIVSFLWRASLDGALAAAAVWLVCRALPRLPAGLRCTLWWLACLRFLLALAGLPAVAVPLPSAAAALLAPARAALIPARAALTSARAARTPIAPAGAAEGAARAWRPPDGARPSAAPGREIATLSVASPPAAAPRPRPRLPWAALAALLGLGWAAGVAWLALRGWRELVAVRRLRAGSRPVEPGPLTELFAELTRRLGVRRRVELRTAAGVPAPQTVGLLRPAILLPEPAAALLTPQELTMALAHELAHVRRRDLLAGWVPALASRLFFFHPLAALAAREYALAREAACDAVALELSGAAPVAYGRLLLRLGVSPRRPAELAALGAAPAFENLKRRLEMLDQACQPTSRQGLRFCLLGLAALLALVPFRLVAGEAGASAAGTPAATSAPAPTARTLAATAKTPAATVKTPAASPLGTPAPSEESARSRARDHHSTVTLSNDGDEGESYVILSGDDTMVNGSRRDIARAKALQGRSGGDLVWFRRDGKEYLVTDPATVHKAVALFAEQRELGERQGELGRRQGELGGKQAELGQKQAELGMKQAELGQSQAQLGLQQAAAALREAQRSLAGEQGEEEGAEDRQGEIGRQQDELGRRQSELGRQQGKLGELQDELGKQQDALGEQQDELGHQQDRLAREAEANLRALVDDLLAHGQAHGLAHGLAQPAGN